MGEINVFGNNVDSYEAWFEKNKLILDAEINAIKGLMPEFEKGIEIGVGTGRFASLLGIKDGVEPSSKMSEKALARGVQVINASAENLPITDGEYELALMVTVDCFLDDVLQAFKEVWRILAQDGYFIVAFLDRETTLGRKYDQSKIHDLFYKYADFHSAEEISSFLEQAGFKIIDRKQTVFSLDNKKQEIRPGTGEGLFAVVKAQKR